LDELKTRDAAAACVGDDQFAARQWALTVIDCARRCPHQQYVEAGQRK
jgi:hypothetical protein